MASWGFSCQASQRTEETLSCSNISRWIEWKLSCSPLLLLTFYCSSVDAIRFLSSAIENARNFDNKWIRRVSYFRPFTVFLSSKTKHQWYNLSLELIAILIAIFGGHFVKKKSWFILNFDIQNFREFWRVVMHKKTNYKQ